MSARYEAGLASVVIPALNASEWIVETVRSALAQRHASLEVIVADNGSTDGTQDLVRSLGERVRVIDAPERGVGAARNAGMDAALGEFVQILDADDVILPGKIARQVRVLRETGADVAWEPFRTLERNAAGAFVATRFVEPRFDADEEASIFRADFFLQIGAILVRRTARTADVRFEPAQRHVEDVPFLFELLSRGARFARSGDGDDGLLFREHSGQRNSIASASYFAGACVANAARAERRWRENGTLTPSRIERLCEVYLVAARQLYEIDRPLFLATVERLRRLDPHFSRRAPSRIRWLARLLGYPRAEALAHGYRRMKQGTGTAPRAHP